MNANWITAVLIAACTIGGGCATSQTPTEKTIGTVKALLVAGKFDMAVAVTRGYFNTDGYDATAVRKELAAYPEIEPAFKFRIRSELEAQSEAGQFEYIAQSIKLAQRDGVISAADAAELLQDTSKRSDTIAHTLHVPSHVWEAMRLEQRQELQRQYIADPIAASSYGTIIDAQSLNESTPGSNAGSQLGSAVAQAAYIDNAFKGNTWHYSATAQLGAGLLGAMAGSLANAPATVQYRTRYTIRTGAGKIEYVDETKAEPFRQTIGICVALAPIRPIVQDFCTISVGAFIVKYAPLAEKLVAELQPKIIGQATPFVEHPLSTPIDPVKAILEIAPHDIAWNAQASITAYAAPSPSAKKIKQIEMGTSFQVEVVLKDWVKIRIGNEAPVWVEKVHLTWVTQ